VCHCRVGPVGLVVEAQDIAMFSIRSVAHLITELSFRLSPPS
jgi:hypothetical protein